jgi:hypothetical protein
MTASNSLVVRERGQHQAVQLGQQRAQVPAHLDPAAVGEPHVEDGHVGRRGGRPLHRFGGGAGLADDLEVVGGLEEVAHLRRTTS